MKNKQFIALIAVFVICALFMISCASKPPVVPETVATPTANPAGGSYTTAQTVTLSTNTEDAIIHYTTNGNDPTASSTAYSAPITINETTTLKAIAVKGGMTDSGILSATYTITPPTAPPPNQTPGAADFNTGELGPIYYDGGPISATISSNSGKSTGNITVYYEGTDGTFYPKSTSAPSALGTYVVTFDVAAANGWDAVQGLSAGTFTIKAFDQIDLVSEFLASQASNDSDNPVYLPIALNLGAMADSDSKATGPWQQLLGALDSSGIYVNLDLYDCTLDGTAFGHSVSADHEKGMSRIVSIILPAGVTSIEQSAFDFDGGNGITSNLKQVTLPEGLTSIGDFAFFNCTSLEEITMPASVESIGVQAFAACAKLETFNLTGEGSLSVIEDGKALVKNDTELLAYPSASGDITLPDGLRSIGDYAFDSCTGLSSITLPDGLTSIGRAAFCDTTSLSTINLPASLTSIGMNAFQRCTGLNQITLPANLASIGESAFSFCTNLTTVICNAARPPQLDNVVFCTMQANTTVILPNLNIKVPAASVNTYQAAANWDVYAGKINGN